jgi:hypothetical protein
VISCTDRLVKLFVQGIAVVLSTGAEAEGTAFNSQLAMHSSKGIREALSSECVVALRHLQTVPAWRVVIVKHLHETLKGYGGTMDLSNSVNSIQDVDMGGKWTDPLCLRMTAASLGVIGGYVDYLRVGGIVTLKPFCPVNSSDTLASRLAGVYHCCALLVSKSAQSGVVEVVLMERSSKPVREVPPAIKDTHKNDDKPQPQLLQYTTTALSTALPVRSIRVNTADITPAADVPVVSEFITSAIFTDVLEILQAVSIPWLKSSTMESSKKKTSKDPEGGSSSEERVESKEERIVRLEYKARDDHDENEDDMEEEDDDDDYNDENEVDDEDDFRSERRARARASRCLIVNEAQDQMDSLLSADTRLSSAGLNDLIPNLSVPNGTGMTESVASTRLPTQDEEVKESLQLFVTLSAFKAFATSLQNDALVYALMPSTVDSQSDADRNGGSSGAAFSSDSPSPSTSRPISPVPVSRYHCLSIAVSKKDWHCFRFICMFISYVYICVHI